MVGSAAVNVCAKVVVNKIVDPPAVVVKITVVPSAVTVFVGPEAVVVCWITLVKIIVEPSKVVVRMRTLPGAVVTSVEIIVEAGWVSVRVSVCGGSVLVKIKVLGPSVIVYKIVDAGKVVTTVEAGCVAV
jgi:hypothetical protein